MRKAKSPLVSFRLSRRLFFRYGDANLANVSIKSSAFTNRVQSKYDRSIWRLAFEWLSRATVCKSVRVRARVCARASVHESECVSVLKTVCVRVWV